MITNSDLGAAANSLDAQRISQIRSLANKAESLNISGATSLADKAVREGWEVSDYQRAIYNNMPTQTPTRVYDPNIGMSQREAKNYSIRKAIMETAEGRLTGLERECHEAARSLNKELPLRGNLSVPQDVVGGAWMTRDSLVATNTLGGFLVGTTLQASSFIDALRVRVTAMRLGAKTLTGLVGNVAIPRLNTSTTVNWLGEVVASTEADIHLGQITLTPKCVGAFVDYSKALGLQSTPDVENIIRMDLTNQIAAAIDRAVYHGPGTAAPTGLQTYTGVNAVTIGENGGAVTWAKLIECEQVVAAANADLSTQAYVCNPKVRAQFKTILKNATGTDAGFIWNEKTPMAPVNGYDCAVSTNIASNLTKGTSTTVCSALFFGCFDQVLMGFWGGLDLLVDNVSQASNRIIRVYADQYVDINFRYPQAFCRVLDITT